MLRKLLTLRRTAEPTMNDPGESCKLRGIWLLDALAACDRAGEREERWYGGKSGSDAEAAYWLRWKANSSAGR